MENGRMQCLFPAEIEALRADRYFLNYTGKGIKILFVRYSASSTVRAARIFASLVCQISNSEKPGRPIGTPSRRKVMRLSSTCLPDMWKACAPVSAARAGRLAGVTPAPTRISRSGPAASTSRRSREAPAGALAACKSWQKDAARARILYAEVRHIRSMRGAGTGTVRMDKILYSREVPVDASLETRLLPESPAGKTDGTGRD